MLDSINKSKEVPFERVLFALGIRFVGETVAKKLANAFENIDKLSKASFEELVAVEDVGDRIAQSILEFFNDRKNEEVIDSLKERGLQFKIHEDLLINKTDRLAGLSIVISGTFEKHSRDEYKSMIELNGGKNAGSISSKTNYILAGDNMGPAKLEKAKKLGVEIINEDQFLKMIE